MTALFTPFEVKFVIEQRFGTFFFLQFGNDGPFVCTAVKNLQRPKMALIDGQVLWARGYL